MERFGPLNRWNGEVVMTDCGVERELGVELIRRVVSA